ncbi:MAG TPA: ATP-binding cassette domain-containing protein [Candidatus Onthoplasma faecipullorum]|nr:ATP-binding cassette domain-containing protein [Candidatus Onthoplasma faecipullorum]
MLEISKIEKVYDLKDQKVVALKGIDICFRRSEFVAILGPSGCGKTTLLNIVGGLDRYTSGDLIIDGVSTKSYKDKDWDNYRNHRVGFVFQSYNLIPHQTILENVELALTLSGIKKAERRARAIEVLNKVGLGDKLKTKPNQLSGGQMQRVAIARALVNDPEIILADEPTGALDSKTSVQIMDLLKEVSKDRLVIMVTHNPELANKYANRIIRLLDGEVIEDSKPYTHEQSEKETKKHKEKLEKAENTGFKKTEKKKSMSFFTALSLSFKNLLTKKGRTAMVSIAGSIGIIGIALILAVSAGMTNYIDRMQSESLSSYPISISAIAIDYNATMNTIQGGYETNESDDNSITIYDPRDTFINMGKYNYISPEFISYVRDYYDDDNKMNYLNDYLISYASDMRLITYDNLTGYTKINSTVTTSALSGTTSSTFFEQVDQDYILSLYDIKGKNAHFPTNRNEVALVVGSDGLSISELMSIGITPTYDAEDNLQNLNYSDVIGKTYKLILNDAYYDSTTLQPKYNFGDEVISQENLQSLYEDTNTIELTITCVLEIKEDASGSIFSNGIMYTHDLANFYHENSMNSQVAENIRDMYLDDDGNFINNGMQTFPISYVVRISELTQYLGTENDIFTYTSPIQMKQILSQAMQIDLTDEEVIDLYLQMYGASEIPNGIYFYASSFEAKDDVSNMLSSWNDREGVYTIVYTDSSALLTNILGTLVDTISYVLIAFAAISLVVSSIMIGIITYTSVIERTKEIGVLRSVGASKGDVSNVFNAETIIIGLMSGLLGVIISAILTVPISLILRALTGISGLATLTFWPCFILVVVSVLLTFIAGLVPARIAAKKDPVAALRSE